MLQTNGNFELSLRTKKKEEEKEGVKKLKRNKLLLVNIHGFFLSQ